MFATIVHSSIVAFPKIFSLAFADFKGLLQYRQSSTVRHADCLMFSYAVSLMTGFTAPVSLIYSIGAPLKRAVPRRFVVSNVSPSD